MTGGPRRWRPAFLAALLFLSCTAREDAPSPATPCTEGCETNIWPRIIVAVLDPQGREIPAERARAVIRLSDGSTQEGHLRGCPELSELVCSYSFFTGPLDRDVILLVETTHRQPRLAEWRIQLGRFNYCGREIAYVEVHLDPGGGSPTLARQRLVSPCD